MSLKYVSVACLFLSAMGCVAADAGDETGDEGITDGESALINNGGLGATGGACKVVGGVNTGKSGTYDEDGWCCGTFGCTECKDSSGVDNGKCKDVKKFQSMMSAGKTISVFAQ